MPNFLITHSPALILLMFATVANGQATDEIEKAVLEAFESKDYNAALARAENLLAADSQRVDALFICGESALALGSTQLAEAYFQRIPDFAKKGIYAVTDLRIAVVKLQLGKCEQARKYFNNYLLLLNNPSDVFLEQVKIQLEKCGEPQNNAASGSMIVTRLGDNINSPGTDIAPLRYADKLYFSAIRSQEKKGKKVFRIFTAVRDEPALDFQGNPREGNVHASQVSLTPDAGKIFYSLCDGDDINNIVKCNLWYRERTYEGGWGPVKKMPSSINMTGYTTFQPAFGYDKVLKKDVLFFVSDRPGGKGKLDIWGTAMELDGSFGQPFNLPFNTPEDDLTPYFENTTQTMFFSSAGLGGLGKFDIFRTEKAMTGDWTPPRNMGYPLNSAFDDLYFSFHTGTHTGYFSSDRPNESCPEAVDSCRNFDIYQARIRPALVVTILEASDSSMLEEATIELMDLATGEIDTTCINIQGNNAILSIDLGKSYRLIVSKKGFFPFFSEISTSQINYPVLMEKNVYLKSMKPRANTLQKAPDTDG